LPPDLDELKADTVAFLDKIGSDMPTYADPDDATRSHVEQVTGWRGYPTTVVIDGDGVVRGKWDGYAPGTENQIAAVVAELMSPTKPEASSPASGGAY
jgi:hypothetical protein